MTTQRKNIHGDGIHDDTNGIQALLDTGLSCVHLPPPKKEYLIFSPLRIRSRQCLRLDPATGIRLAPLQGHQAWLDGNPFNDTLATGNAFPGFSCTNHLATKHLAAGRPLLVVRFISGKNSSVLHVGGPAEVKAQDSWLEK